MIFGILLFILSNELTIAERRINVLMPNVSTTKMDTYMVKAFQLNDDNEYITVIEPLTNAKIAHHMFAYGCERPASNESSWKGADLCRGTQVLLFAWGLNAKALELPKDVTFRVGPRTNLKYIVINVHYLNIVSNDNSGVAIYFSEKPRTYEAGIMILYPNLFAIPPKTKKYSTTMSCEYKGNELKMFAVRVHAHNHGDVNTAFRVRDDKWLEIAKGDPQLPQAFYPTKEVYDLVDGDALLGMCTYHNDETRTVYPGNTHTDEMCNIYIMYYTPVANGIQDSCTGHGYPLLERQIPANASDKLIVLHAEKKYEEDQIVTTYSQPVSTKQEKIIVTSFVFIMIAFLVSIAFLIRRQKRRQKKNIIRFQQISSGINSKSAKAPYWQSYWPLNGRNKKIDFSKLSQHDEVSDSEETLQFNKKTGAPLTHNLQTDSESEDVVMSFRK
jgi:hypothetical protein